MFRGKLSIFFAALLMALIVGQSLAVACPTCKEGLAASDPEYASMVRGYFWSIIFMMSMPFLTLASLAGYFYYEVRRARLGQSQPRRAELAPSSPQPA